MKSSNIGGQAVMEGVMMKSGDKYAVAVRKSDGTIEVDVQSCAVGPFMQKVKKIPFVRGVFNFVDSLSIGMKALSYSADFFEDEEAAPEGKEQEEAKKSVEKQGWIERTFKDKAESIVLGITIVFAVILSLALFCGLPFLLAEGIRAFITKNDLVVAIAEGILRIAIFLLYVFLISLMEDIQRFFAYHGAEHKCINCIENGMELTVENVRKSSKQHKRCGTSFLLIVMVISIIFLIFINFENAWVRLLVRLALIPVIAGISYEFIRLAGNSDNKFVNLLSKPGLWLQNLTTKEPKDDMIEVAIKSVEAVFDWKKYLEENLGESVKAEEAVKEETAVSSHEEVVEEVKTEEAEG